MKAPASPSRAAVFYMCCEVVRPVWPQWAIEGPLWQTCGLLGGQGAEKAVPCDENNHLHGLF